MVEDRFTKISGNYGELFTEVFAEQGLDYEALQRSVMETVSKFYPSFRTASILDIGTGDGETIAPFVKAGCKNLTGIDLNQEMLGAAKKKFGNKARFLQVDATHMDLFKPKEFDIIVTAMCIHNIPTKDRSKFWNELLRLKPKIFVAAEKIAYENPGMQKKAYDNEVRAVIKVYKEKHKLDKVAEEWVRHYEYDEREKLTLDEIKKNLAKSYDIKLVSESGMAKVIIATNKN